jgi:hypothetical protein
MHRDPLRDLEPRLMRRLCLLAGGIGVLITTTGCGAAILARYDAVAFDAPPERAFPLGSPRQEIEHKLGKPDASKALPDGTHVDTYTYTIRNPEWRKTKQTILLVSMMTVGFAEPFLVPWASYDVAKHRRTATLRYDADDTLLDQGLHAGYGPSDDGLPPLSFETIRDTCRSDSANAVTAPAGGTSPPNRTYSYQACVVRRLAIWGIE